MRRIALIESGVSDPRKFVYQVYPPHGLMYIASFLRSKRPEIQIKIFDLMISRQREADILSELINFSPELVGIHAMHFQAKSSHRIARMIKENLSASVVIGGPYPSSEPEAALSDQNIDVAVRGEGELTFLELIKRLEAGQDLAGLAGAAHRLGDKIMIEPDRDFIPDLDQVPFPAWDLIDMQKFFDWKVLTQNDIRWRRELATIFTSRACPYGCIFCHNMFGKRFRARSPENVLQEIKLLYEKFGVREIHIIDDCFNFDMERAKRICRMIVDSGMDIKFAFPNGIRGDRLDRELIQLLKAAGVYKVNFGIETGSERMQKMIHKNIDLEKIKANIELLTEAGIFTHGFFIMGFPSETEEDLKATITFAVKSRLHTAGFALLTAFPHTRVREMAEEMGKHVAFESEDTSYARIACNLTDVSDRRLLANHRKAYWTFYFRPSQALRILGSMPNKWMLPRLLLAHFRLKFL